MWMLVRRFCWVKEVTEEIVLWWGFELQNYA